MADMPTAGSLPLRITSLLPCANDDSLGDRRWKNATTRVRCLEIAAHLGVLGAQVKLVESTFVDRRMANGSFFDADVFVIYQTLEDHRDIVTALLDAGKCVVSDVCDNVRLYPGALGRTWENACRAHGITVPTKSLADRLAGGTDTPIHVIPDAVEGDPRPVRLPRADGPLRLFWYGWQHKLAALEERLPALVRFAARRPLVLGIMTNMDPVGPVLQRILDASDDRLMIRAEPWQFAAFNHAMAEADIAIVPYTEKVSYSGRSPVRLIQALWQGRLALSEDLDAYPEFARFGLLHESLVDGLAWAVDHPIAAAQAMHNARRYVADTHHPSVLAAKWLQTLTEIHGRFLATCGAVLGNAGVSTISSAVRNPGGDPLPTAEDAP